MITITKRETNLTFAYTGTDYDIQGTATFNSENALTNVNLNVNGKDSGYVGYAQAYMDNDGKPKVNISNVDADSIAKVVADVQNCITELKTQNSTEE